MNKALRISMMAAVLCLANQTVHALDWPRRFMTSTERTFSWSMEGFGVALMDQFEIPLERPKTRGDWHWLRNMPEWQSVRKCGEPAPQVGYVHSFATRFLHWEESHVRFAFPLRFQLKSHAMHGRKEQLLSMPLITMSVLVDFNEKGNSTSLNLVPLGEPEVVRISHLVSQEQKSQLDLPLQVAYEGFYLGSPIDLPKDVEFRIRFDVTSGALCGEDLYSDFALGDQIKLVQAKKFQ